MDEVEAIPLSNSTWMSLSQQWCKQAYCPPLVDSLSLIRNYKHIKNQQNIIFTATKIHRCGGNPMQIIARKDRSEKGEERGRLMQFCERVVLLPVTLRNRR
jgi:hypothetical protein